MITPLDIQNKTFKTEFKGYCKSEVDEFLNLIIQSYEKIYRESIEFREQISFLERTVENYKALENTLKDTLVVAQQTSEHVKIQANEEARVIINEAKMTAKKLVNDAHEEVKKISFKYEELKRSIGVYQARMISLLNSQLDLLNNTATSEKTLVELLGVNEALEELAAEKASEINNESVGSTEYNEDATGAFAAEDNEEHAVDVLLSALSADQQEDDTEE
jgi:cell division initiation protein